MNRSTHRRECECVECLAEYGDWLEFLRLIALDPEPDAEDDYDAWADDLDAINAELGEGVAGA
jgi:hypothetical protein